MLKIDNLTLHLPPEFAGRERALGNAVARALADTPVTGDQAIARLTQTVSVSSPLQGNDAIANRIATGVHRQLGSSKSEPARSGRVQWPR